MKKGSEDEELCAIAAASDQQNGPERCVEKVLNLARRTASQASASQASASPSSKERTQQLNASMDMLSRVFPFHARAHVEHVLDVCHGDVAKTVQHLVGNRTNQIDGAGPNKSDPFLPLSSIGWSFLPN